METVSILNEIQRLPLSKQIYIAEWIIKSIREKETKSQMEIAAEKLCKEYMNNSELTIFTNLDFRLLKVDFIKMDILQVIQYQQNRDCVYSKMYYFCHNVKYE